MLLALVGCSKDDDSTSDTSLPISFSCSGEGEVTRAGDVALNEYIKDFTVYGINGTVDDAGTFTKKFTVFPNYQVWYTENSANTTSSNSSNWEYVGTDKNGNEQTIKYWDEKTQRHYFWAVGDASYQTQQVIDNGLAKKFTVYNVSLDAVKDDKKCLYYSDPVLVEKSNYNKPVQLSFHRFASKIRVGFYEDVEQAANDKLYHVTGLQFFDVFVNTNGEAEFYTESSVGSPMSNKVCLKGEFVENAQVDINYSYEGATPAANAVIGNESNQTKLMEYFGTLNVSEDTPLPTSSATALFAMNGDSQYTTVMPYSNTSGLTMKCYVKVDKDSSWQTLYASVPASYTNWLPNHSYTYIFKIVTKLGNGAIELADVRVDEWKAGESQQEYWHNW